MKRKLLDKIIEWNREDSGIPLLIKGARGVGKTYLIYNFAKENYSSNLYFNFEQDYNVRTLFSKDCTQTLQNINTYFETNVDYNNTIIILDEFSQCDNVINFINSSSSHHDKLHIICANSDVNNIETNYTIKAKELTLHPFDFEEFLIATNNEWYAEAIREHFTTNKPLPDIVHEELLDIFNNYMYIGGMPSVINEYIIMDSYINISEKQNLLTNSNLSDLRSKISDGEFVKVMSVYSTISSQLMKENKKFKYSIIRRGATRKIYENTINYLCSTGYITKCNKFKDVSEEDNFKLYMNDVGILYSMSKNIYNEEYNKALIENYVLQNLIANDNKVTFWESKSQAKIDFVAEKENKLYAIEVKNGNNTRSKNYSIFKENVPENTGLIKISTKNFIFNKGVKYIPLYAVFCI